MHRSLAPVVLTLMVAITASSPALAADPSGFEQMVSHYETARQALLHDSLSGVEASANRIRDLAGDLERGLDASRAGIRPDAAGELAEVLPAVREAGDELGKAKTLAAARDAFGDLSTALVRFRRLVEDPSPAVAFCSMAQKVWLQPSGEIGNPYYGQSMARCGEFVSR